MKHLSRRSGFVWYIENFSSRYSDLVLILLYGSPTLFPTALMIFWAHLGLGLGVGVGYGSQSGWATFSILSSWSSWSSSSDFEYEILVKTSSSTNGNFWVIIRSFYSVGFGSCTWSSSNWTLRSMKHFLVAIFIHLYAFASFAYLNSMHSVL